MTTEYLCAHSTPGVEVKNCKNKRSVDTPEVCDDAEDAEDADECPVCMDPFGERETIVLSKCRHRYHTDCRAELEKAGFEGCSYRCEGSALASWIQHDGQA